MLQYSKSDEWQLQLISLYVWIEEGFRLRGWSSLVERFSPNKILRFGDDEALTCFVFAKLRGHKTYKSGWRFLRDFLSEWFPRLPRYSAWMDRLHRLTPALLKASEELTENLVFRENDQFLIDSCPVVMAQALRASRACVASDIATRGYCASKRMHYYGVKIHAIMRRRPGRLPEPVAFAISSSSTHDIQILKHCVSEFNHGKLFADLAYASKEVSDELRSQGCELCTPIKKTKGKFHFPGQNFYNHTISRTRHSIESFFSWIQEKTQIQTAFRARSSKGLFTFLWSSIFMGLVEFYSLD